MSRGGGAVVAGASGGSVERWVTAPGTSSSRISICGCSAAPAPAAVDEVVTRAVLTRAEAPREARSIAVRTPAVDTGGGVAAEVVAEVEGAGMNGVEVKDVEKPLYALVFSISQVGGGISP